MYTSMIIHLDNIIITLNSELLSHNRKKTVCWPKSALQNGSVNLNNQLAISSVWKMVVSRKIPLGLLQPINVHTKPASWNPVQYSLSNMTLPKPKSCYTKTCHAQYSHPAMNPTRVFTACWWYSYTKSSYSLYFLLPSFTIPFFFRV